MARASRSTKLETRTSRLKLKQDNEPSWANIGKGLYLGYRKGAKGGSWIARYLLGDKKYKKQSLGKADDYQDANNIDVLNYFQAQDKARQFANEQAHQTAGISQKALTVADITENYLKWFKVRRKSYDRTKHAIETDILPKLGHLKIDQLTTTKIRSWHETMAQEPPRLRSTKIKQNYAEMDTSTEGQRKRKATANRVLTVLKAALNHAWREGLISSNASWQKTKPFPNVNAPKIQYLELAECQRLINACEPDFRQLVRGALLTGCRYGELTHLKVQDFNISNGSLHVIETKNGKPRHMPLTEEGITFFNQTIIGKSANDFIFTRNDGGAWGKSHQARRLKEACKIAKIDSAALSFHSLRHSYGSLLASNGVPLQVIAELLGHSDTRITQKHYAHLTPSFVSETLKTNLPRFSEDEKTNVSRIDDKKASNGDLFK